MAKTGSISFLGTSKNLLMETCGVFPTCLMFDDLVMLELQRHVAVPKLGALPIPPRISLSFQKRKVSAVLPGNLT